MARLRPRLIRVRAWDGTLRRARGIGPDVASGAGLARRDDPVDLPQQAVDGLPEQGIGPKRFERLADARVHEGEDALARLLGPKSEADVEAHGLTPFEYERIVELLGLR